MSIVGRGLFALTHKLRGSRSLALLSEIAKAPYAPREVALSRQFEMLSRLLAHAERHVPYYRETFVSLGIRSRDIRSLADLSELPVLTKDVLRERRDDLVSETVSRESLFPQHSGGSTGVPLSFYRDRDYLDASDAGTYRNLRQAGWRPGEMVAFFWGWNERLSAMSAWEFELRQHLRRSYQFDPFRSGAEDMNRWICKWNAIRPAVAFGYASTISRFAAHITSTGQDIRPVRGVFTTAEKLYAPQRAAIEKAFGCRVFDCYGSSEVQNIAAECPVGRMHVNVDYVVLETDDEKGAPGVRPLVVTSLRAYALPFIRYLNEDCGELVESACNCGNMFPLMRLNISRTSDNFMLPDGRVVHGEFFTHLMYGSEGIERFQFHQTATDRIELLIVPVFGGGASERRAAAVRRAVEEIRNLCDAPIVLDVREVDSIPLSAAGKHRFTRSDVGYAVRT